MNDTFDAIIRHNGVCGIMLVRMGAGQGCVVLMYFWGGCLVFLREPVVLYFSTTIFASRVVERRAGPACAIFAAASVSGAHRRAHAERRARRMFR